MFLIGYSCMEKKLSQRNLFLDFLLECLIIAVKDDGINLSVHWNQKLISQTPQNSEISGSRGDEYFDYVPRTCNAILSFRW